MVHIALWCRHKTDHIIGIGSHIPWHVSSDFKRFKRLTMGKSLIVGEKTYESFPGRTLPGRRLYILSYNPTYPVSDPQNHFIVTHPDKLPDVPEMYIAGGASVYTFFMRHRPPEIILDSVYQGPLQEGLNGTPVTLTECVKILEEKYIRLAAPDCCDQIETSVFLRRDACVDGALLAHIFTQIYSAQ